MEAMSARQFYKAIKGSFGLVLEPRGFTCADSKRANFTRWVSDDICHVFCFSRSRGLTMYEVFCFATSPLIQPDFSSRYPDTLGASTSPHMLDPIEGVGASQHRYFCKNNDAFTRSFNRDAAPALGKAVDFLDQIVTLTDLERFVFAEDRKAVRAEIARRCE